MSIVMKLRHWAKPDKFGKREGRADDFAEAADEIERLKAELEIAKMDNTDYRGMLENKRLRAVLTEIANRAANMMDDDAASWMPSIYKLACEAIDENPWQLLKAAGYTEETMSISLTAPRTADGGGEKRSDDDAAPARSPQTAPAPSEQR